MKKLIITALSTIVVATTAMGLTACGKEYKYDFMVDGEVYQSVILDKDFVKPADPTKTGYTFAGWFIDGSDVAYTDFSVKLEADVQLVAKWTVNQYSISFDTNGAGTIDTITQDYNSSVTAPEAPTKAYYDFAGWYEAGSNTAYEFNTIEARDVALTAKWTIKKYSINFNSDGGTAVDTITQDYQSSVTAPTAPTKEGYTFAGWFEEGSATAYEFNTIEARTVELKAKWTINQYTINFNSDGGTAVAPITQDYATSVSAPTAPTKEHYDFVGWYEAGSATAYNFNTIEARNVDLIAKWTIKKYSITFDSNGGSLVDTITQDYDSAVSAPADPTKEGYTFAGWCKEGSSVQYTFSKIEGQNITVVAQWTINQYSISFDTDGVGEIDDIVQDYGSTVTAPAAPVKEHYDFIGWFEDGSDVAYEFATIEARNVALKARYIVKQYTINFASAGGTSVKAITADYNALVSAPVSPTRDGYAFDGWYEEGETEAYVFSNIEGRNITLVAKWTKAYDGIFEMYKFNEDKTGRVENEDELTIEKDGETYTIEASTIKYNGEGALVSAGSYVNVEVADGVSVNIFVVTAVLKDADEVANMIYLMDYRLFDAENGEGVGNRHQHGFGNYLMLGADIDMSGKSIVKSKNPYSFGQDYRTWGFLGIFDGNGHVLYNLNSSLFTKIGYYGEVKNLGIVSVDGSSLIASQIFGIINNVYINNTIIDSGTSSLTGTLSVDAKVSNTVIVVNNAIGKADAYAVSKDGNNATFVNAFVFTNGNAFETAPGTLPTIYALDGKIDGNLNDFVREYWDVTGNQPLWLNAKVTSIKDVALYGKYVLNTAKDGREENTADLVVANGDKNITIPASKVSSLDVGRTTSYIIKDGTDFVVVTVKKATAVLKTADDLANWVRLAGGGGTNWGHGTYIMLGEDIDATGVSIYYNQNPYYHEEGWGYTGTFDGNGHTISNLKSPLITVLKNTTIKNLKLVNCLKSSPTGNYMTALTLDNCDFEFDASDIADLMLFASGVAGKTTVSNCKFTIKNAKDSTKISFGSSMRSSGILTISNVSVTTNAGTFKAIADQTSEYDFTGATTKTIASASFAPIA